MWPRLFIFLSVIGTVYLTVVLGGCGEPAYNEPAFLEADLGFLAMGDTGNGTREQLVVARAIAAYCARTRCEFMAGLGDNFYPVGVASKDDPQWKTKFEDPYAELRFPFYSSLGNHDYDGAPKAQIAYAPLSRGKWIMPSEYYSYKKMHSEFFVIDTNAFDARQQAWLKNGLDTSTEKWKFVYGHHPIYSYGHHGDTPALKRDLLPILRGRADFYLCGHDHDRQVLEMENGVSFVVSGAAADTRGVARGPRTLFASPMLGFSHILVNETEVEVRMIRSDSRTDFVKRYSKP